MPTNNTSVERAQPPTTRAGLPVEFHERPTAKLPPLPINGATMSPTKPKRFSRKTILKATAQFVEKRSGSRP